MTHTFTEGHVNWKVTDIGTIDKGIDGQDTSFHVVGEFEGGESTEDDVVTRQHVYDMVKQRYFYERGNVFCRLCSIYHNPVLDDFVVTIHVRYDN